ncbi:unnamed protein product (macronuclear) [Paramecium tetraurelia]|uniref:Uncharacterized protein n=1 Tax=Paramecium tetraurelia TaxID=5888 RepID=A0E7U0_PARTE|nr:uncharacterized protein GSPATT00024085001 [Paramecium tetraurelia]CAK91357.1 unnamed protein product [Paramecium tetraurelia]|eukprot:XP_001458754.1 hypothetical protein (macronuclear) [Paramecium tetraurelia strain d4-2]
MEFNAQKNVFELVKLSFPQYTEENTLINCKNYLCRILNLKTKYQVLDDIIIEKEINENENKVLQMRLRECFTKLLKSKIQKNQEIIHFILRVSQLGKQEISNNSQEQLFFENSNIIKSSIDIENQQTTNQTINKLDNSLITSIILEKQQNSITQEVNDKDLMKDILFCLQGIEGQYIQYDASSDSFCLRKDVNISISVRQLVNLISECGWLYKKISSFCQVQQPNLIVQALQNVIKLELSEYYKLIANLEGMILSSQLITFKRIHFHLQSSYDYMIQINQLLSIIQTSTPLGATSCLIINVLDQFSKHGCSQMAELFARLQKASCQPLMKYINEWIFEGNLLDIANEFFIEKDDQKAITKDQGELWRKQYRINYDKVPVVISYDEAYKIYDTGRAINWLRIQCDNRNWYLKIQPLTINILQTKELSQLINQANKKTNTELVNLLFGKFKLMDHFNIIKQYFLLGNGNFSQLLIETLYKELSKKGNLVYKHTLTGLVESTLRMSNAKQIVLQRLSVKLLEAQKNDIGWDIFCLDYEFEEPLRTLFNRKTMLNYYKIFNYLWRIKRVEYTLIQSWMQQIKNKCYLNVKSNVNKALHLSLQIMNSMIHFIKSFFSYLMLDAIEAPWKKFMDQINQIENLDHLIQLHEQLLNEIIDKVFLNQKQEQIQIILLKLFEISFRYKQNLEHLFLYVRELMAKDRSDRFEQSMDPRVSHKTTSTYSINIDPEFKGQEIIKLLLQLRQMHKEQILELIKQLQNEEKMKFLLLKLDFNEYYNLLSQEKLFSLGFEKFLQQCPIQINETVCQKQISEQPQSQLLKPSIPQLNQKSMTFIQQDDIQINEGINHLEEQKKQKKLKSKQQIQTMQKEATSELQNPMSKLPMPFPQPQQPIITMSPINQQSLSDSNILQSQSLKSVQQQFSQKILQQTQINHTMQQLQQQQQQQMQQQQHYVQLQSKAKPQLSRKSIAPTSQIYQIQPSAQPNFNNSILIFQNQSQSQISVLQPSRNDMSLSQDENLQQLMDKDFCFHDNNKDGDLI